MTRRSTPALVGLLTMLVGAARGDPTEGAPPPAPAMKAPTMIKVVLRNARGRAVGRLTLTEAPRGVVVHGTLSGLSPGMHAIHFHETGKCEPPFKTAGGHFNPTQKSHGMLDPNGQHAGDLPNLVVPRSGKLVFEAFAESLTLGSGPNALLDGDGAAVVIHAHADDHHTQPSGDSGDRIACGVVTR